VKITYVGHATTIIDSKGYKLVTDPVLIKRPGRLGPKRQVELKLDDDALRGLDLVTISHGHFDHLDKRSLCMIDEEVPVICHPRLVGIVKRSCSRRPIGLDWWEETTINDVKITAVPVLHFAARPPFQWKKDYQGYVIEKEGELTVLHVGDCGMSDYFKEIADRFDIDVAILPIGAYHPPSFRKHHLAPEDALEVVKMLDARYLIPIHWGVFKLSWEPFDEPPKRLMMHAKEMGLEDRVRLLDPGESSEL
jgi:L-ascorbate metabolism protein UlaG (beta-lactamase superfamily)